MVCTSRINLLHLKLSSNRVVFVAKGFLKQLNLPIPIKQESIYPFPEIGSRDFCRITTSVPSKGKSAIPPLFNCPELLFSASDEAKLFAKKFLEYSNLDDSVNSLPAFPSRTNLNMHNISASLRLVKRVTTNLVLSKTSDRDSFPVAVLRKCETELSYILVELFTVCLTESFLTDCWKVFSTVLVFKNVGKGL